ncbi:MAG: type II toxin-antitoxin system VapC family toxin [Micromonosporaceae bacterium]
MRSSAIFCLDAGVVVRSFQPDYPHVHRLWAEWRKTFPTLVAPTLLRYEVTNAFYRQRQAGMLDDETLHRTLTRASALDIEFYDEPALHSDAVRIAEQHGLPAAYDAHYLALSQRLGVDFFTTDAKLVKAVGDKLPWVRLVG